MLMMMHRPISHVRMCTLLSAHCVVAVLVLALEKLNIQRLKSKRHRKKKKVFRMAIYGRSYKKTDGSDRTNEKSTQDSIGLSMLDANAYVCSITQPVFQMAANLLCSTLFEVIYNHMDVCWMKLPATYGIGEPHSSNVLCTSSFMLVLRSREKSVIFHVVFSVFVYMYIFYRHGQTWDGD